MSPTPKPMGKRIRALRKKQNLSRQELAAKARVSREYIRKLEAGGYDRVGTPRRLAKALSGPVTELLEQFRRTKAMAGAARGSSLTSVRS